MQNNKPLLTVSQLNEYIKALLDADRIVSGVYVRGEISNFKYQSTSGHMYMSLKDENSSIRAVMFKYDASRLKFLPQNGMKVVALGRVSSYVKEGQYQLYIDSMVPDGAGELAVRYEQLKNKLSKEGLFDSAHKKPLPKYPGVIGVITSPTGAAVHDIINICTRRFPYAKIVLYPVAVQGDGAAEQMIAALDFFSYSGYADVIIIGRGGGSAEDLWQFYNEELARAVYRCQTPVISAVGHETDTSIIDFVADKSAPTPSAAAEIAVPDAREIIASIETKKIVLDNLLTGYVETRARTFKALSESYVFRDPNRMFDGMRIRCDGLADALDSAAERYIEAKKSYFRESASKLEMLDPLKVLLRGYAAVYNYEDKALSSVKDLTVGETLDIRMSDGRVCASVLKIIGDKKRKNNTNRK